MNLVAIIAFGLGLLLVAIGGIALALAATKAGVAAWGAWPLAILIALVLPQFLLPPVGRMTYGVAFLLAAVLFAAVARRAAGKIEGNPPL